jgi:hypothetical protein
LTLESWEVILFQLATGCLISGFILFIFSIITAEFHFGHDSTDVGDISADTDISFDGHPEIHFELETDAHFDSDLGHETNLEKNSTPILLLLSSFFLMFGAIGYSIYQAEVWNPIIRIILLIFIPIGFVKLISIFWKKFTSFESAYEVPKVKIDNAVKTITKVDEKGGLVLAETNDIERIEKLHLAGSIKMQARTLSGSIDRDSVAYVIAIEKNTLIIDSWPKPPNK